MRRSHTVDRHRRRSCDEAPEKSPARRRRKPGTAIDPLQYRGADGGRHETRQACSIGLDDELYNYLSDGEAWHFWFLVADSAMRCAVRRSECRYLLGYWVRFEPLRDFCWWQAAKLIEEAADQIERQ